MFYHNVKIKNGFVKRRYADANITEKEFIQYTCSLDFNKIGIQKVNIFNNFSIIFYGLVIFVVSGIYFKI